ncbi:hypothetical protein BCR34DRAFT_479781 [Clohesyomyces aquaticus]|uniref:AMP-dependent synthetase/ligase domain-containing protein n=1 Tax=Clohesyomyces aquaticus TaxID=1231657 RepID=A0A1Y1ZVN0_9PLEO|nr:hypothetical protein BCR34DRAFT_479781 [Clohesyomyces aquaticus]
MPVVPDISQDLLVNIIEYKAQWLTGHTFMRYPAVNWKEDGYRTLTWGQYSDTINKVAHWLDEKLGELPQGQTVAYLGPSDARYSIILPAVIKTNRKILIPDGRVTREGMLNLIHSSECQVWIYPEDDDHQTCELGIQDMGLKLQAFPPLDWCLDSNGHERYPYQKKYEEGKNDEIVIIHTSGTTGLPKPIRLTNAYLSTLTSFRFLSRKYWPRGITYDAFIGKTMLSGCPPQWIGGQMAHIYAPVFLDCSSIMPPPNEFGLPPANFTRIVQANVVEGILSPPHTITQLYHDPDTLPLLKSLDYICYAGAPLDLAIGDDLCEHTRLMSIMGATETGPQVSTSPLNKSLWRTYSFAPENGHRMERIPGSGIARDGSDDLHELVIERRPDVENIFQCAFFNPAHKYLSRIEVKELYAPVTDLDGQTRWAFAARKDDLTKLTWLAKFHAHDIETRVQQYAENVSHVLVGGEGRPTPYVIVEPKDDTLDENAREALLDELYSHVVTRVNEKDIEEITIPKETVIITKKGKPLQKTAKQTLARKEIEKDYETEIEEAYERLRKARSR